MESEHPKNQHLSIPISEPDEKKIYKPRTAEKPKTVTVLSIDGGGTRGIIPAVALLQLEKFLQDIDKGANVRISDYFDVISGSGMGSIIAAMLTVPDVHHQKRPRYTMQQILDSLIKEIFHTFRKNLFSWIFTALGESSPKENFKQIIRDKLKGAQLNQTLSNVVIPVYDGKNKRLVILSSSSQPKDDISLSDAVIGSSAMPGFLDPLEIKYQDEYCRFFDCGLVSTNPTLFALQEAEKHVIKTEPDYKNYLVLSLGTAKRRGLPKLILHLPNWLVGYFVNIIWGDWLPRIVQYAFDTISDTTEIYITQLLQCHDDNKNYLRIQAHKDDFKTSMSDQADGLFEKWIKRPIESVINATEIRQPVPALTDGSAGSLDKFKEIANRTLQKLVKHIHPYTGDHFTEKDSQTTNKMALKEFAKKLSEERKRRLLDLQFNNKLS